MPDVPGRRPRHSACESRDPYGRRSRSRRRHPRPRTPAIPVEAQSRDIAITSGRSTFRGILAVPAASRGVVLFAHGSGSGRLSSRNTFVARRLNAAGLGTLLVDLLSEDEEQLDARTGHLRFDIPFLAGRLLDATEWLVQAPESAGLGVSYFGASTGAAAALIAAAERPEDIRAVVSRGGRPDLAEVALHRVRAPTLLIVGGDDGPVIPLNQQAFDGLKAEKEMVIVPGAGHLFEEPGTLEQVADLAAAWFVRHGIRQ